MTAELPAYASILAQQPVDVEQYEGPVVTEAHRLHQSRVHAGQVRALGDRLLRDLEEVEHLTDPQPVPAARHVHDHDRSLVVHPALLLEEHVAVEHGEQGPADVDQPFDRLRDPGNPGSRQARQDLPHDPCRGRANKRTDPKDDGVERLRISHLY